MASFYYRDLGRPRYKTDVGISKQSLPTDELLMSVNNVCARLKLSRSTVNRDIRLGLLPAEKVTFHSGRRGFKYYIRESDFKLYAANKKVRFNVKVPKDEEL